jgi:hypothetical protein
MPEDQRIAEGPGLKSTTLETRMAKLGIIRPRLSSRRRGVAPSQ